MPRYVQFPRSNVAGGVPTEIDHGSFAVNTVDRKVYVGGPGREPLLMAYRVADFDPDRGYRVQDIAYHEGSLWRCKVSFTTGQFNPSQWLELTDVSTAPYKELSGTSWISGGAVSLAPPGGISVGAGSGVVVNAVNVGNPAVTPVSWNARTFMPPFDQDETVAIGVSAGGSFSLQPSSNLDSEWRRTHVLLGWFTTDATGNAVQVDNALIGQHQTKETLADLLNVIGPFKVSGGDMNLSGISQIRVASGRVFWQGIRASDISPNLASVQTLDPFGMLRADRGGYTDTTPQTSLDVANYDNGAGVAPVPAGKFTIQFIFLLADLGTGIALYGQDLYDTIDAALTDVAAVWDQEVLLPPVVRETILLGAVVSDDAGTSQAVVNAATGFGEPFGGSGGTGDTSQFLLISGVRPMQGDLDLGGNGLTNGSVDGEAVTILPKASGISGEPVSPGPGELAANTTDGKVYVGSSVVSDRIDLYSASRLYAVGDKAIQNNNLYRCTTAITAPEAFTPGKWQLIGADNSGALTQAVVIAPDSPDRNTIDVTGQGGTVAALKTTFDNSQSVDLYEFSPNATISRFGIPEKAFGEAVFRVSQVAHSFADVGTAVYFNGVSWLPASNADPDNFPQAIIHEIIDADNFLLQTGGRINNLSPGAFVGGAAPTAGQFYYASGTPGKLTSTEGATPVPVLYTLSATSALVKLTGTRIPTVLTPDDVVDIIYPVGSLISSLDPANPSLRYPGTTWLPYAEGRALVGVGMADGTTWSVGSRRARRRIRSRSERCRRTTTPILSRSMPSRRVTASTSGGAMLAGPL